MLSLLCDDALVVDMLTEANRDSPPPNSEPLAVVAGAPNTDV